MTTLKECELAVEFKTWCISVNSQWKNSKRAEWIPCSKDVIPPFIVNLTSGKSCVLERNVTNPLIEMKGKCIERP